MKPVVRALPLLLLLLATIAQSFRLEHAEGHRVAMNPRVTLNPKHGMEMVARAR